jgi:hypothetical protein
MSTTYQGLATNVTSPLTASINGATSATPIVIQTAAPHNFQTGDQIIISGVLWGGGLFPVNTPRSNPWTITVVDATHFSLNGSTNPGNAYAGAGLATDLSATPATTIPSDGDNRNAASVNVPLETALDRTQFIVPRLGRYRFLDQYLFRALDDTFASYATMTPSAAPGTATITGASNTSPIVITATAHGFTTGDNIAIASVTGNTAANGTWIITVLTANTFSLTGPTVSVGNGVFGGVPTCQKNWVSMTGMSGLLSFGSVAVPTPNVNFNDVLDVQFQTTAGWGATAQGICLGISVASGAYQPIAGTAFLGNVSVKQLLNLRGIVGIGDICQPQNSGNNNQLFNLGVMLVTNAGSPQAVTLYGSRELVVNHYRLVA